MMLRSALVLGLIMPASPADAGAQTTLQRLRGQGYPVCGVASIPVQGGQRPPEYLGV